MQDSIQVHKTFLHCKQVLLISCHEWVYLLEKQKNKDHLYFNYLSLLTLRYRLSQQFLFFPFCLILVSNICLATKGKLILVLAALEEMFSFSEISAENRIIKENSCIMCDPAFYQHITIVSVFQLSRDMLSNNKPHTLYKLKVYLIFVRPFPANPLFSVIQTSVLPCM